jgi:hypothetical protein
VLATQAQLRRNAHVGTFVLKIGDWREGISWCRGLMVWFAMGDATDADPR